MTPLLDIRQRHEAALAAEQLGQQGAWHAPDAGVIYGGRK